MWEKGWRDRVWSLLDNHWDIIVIGGGITGAGILREAARAGLSVLLLEANDFASGTSSRSSKLVHGGFRYLKNGQLKLLLESVRERERLLSEGRGLVSPLGFLMANFRDDPIPAWMFGAGLILYDLLALKWGHRRYDAYDMRELCPYLTEDRLLGGYRYFDAQTDDARLVLRVIQEAIQDGGVSLNYAKVTHLLHSRSGQVCGVAVQDMAPGVNSRTIEIKSPVVVNATGAWAEEIRPLAGDWRNARRPQRLRKLRGSHLVIPTDRLPLTRAVSFLHPNDGRPVFAFPWEGVTIVGTTDVDHNMPLQIDPAISSVEAEYLMEAVQRTFPAQEISYKDIQGTFSGIRPVINTGKTDPSKESREHVLWSENGLLTVTGGKLTTFRLMAHDALKKVRTRLPSPPTLDPDQRVLAEHPLESIICEDLSPATRLRLLGRHGAYASDVISTAQCGELDTIVHTPILWAELRWAARAEGVVHLDDLLLRRARLGLLLPNGGLCSENSSAPFTTIDRIRSIVQPELGWDDTRWKQEISNYATLWKKCYHLGDTSTHKPNQYYNAESDDGHERQQLQRPDPGDRQRHTECTGAVI